MDSLFQIDFEFDQDVIENKVTQESQKGYICFVDSNLLAESYKSPEIKSILNNSLINACDGSYIALLGSFIHKHKYKSLNGPTFFNKYIYYDYVHCIVGNTTECFEKAQKKAIGLKGNITIYHVPLPFVAVEEFDYKSIADDLNHLKPRFIWVSLGAPKQEIFMSKLQPYIKFGIMFGIGAALNYYAGDIKDIPSWAKRMHLIWFHRIITEPRKQLKRISKIIRIYPNIYFEERKSFRSKKLVLK